MSKSKKRSVRIAVALVAMVIVLVQQIHGASANAPAPPYASTSTNASSTSDSSYGSKSSGVSSPAGPGAGQTGSSTSSTKTAVGSSSSSPSTGSACKGRDAFGPMTVHVNGTKVGSSNGPTPGSPFDGWQELVEQGDELRIGFQVAPGCGQVPVALASYQTVEPLYHEENAHLQTLFDSASGNYTDDGEMHYLSVSVAECYFQVDFATDAVHKTLQGSTYKDKLAGAAVGGTKGCAVKPAETTTTTSTTTTSTTTTSTTSTTSTTVAPKVECPTRLVDRISGYSVEQKSGSKTSQFDSMGGNIDAGARVTVDFTTAEGCKDTFSLASYEAKSTKTTKEALAQQTLHDSQTKTFGPGEHSLTVDVPDCFFQVDFVQGNVIKDLSQAQYGGRLLDTDVGGEACKTEVLDNTTTKQVTVAAPQAQPKQLAATGIDLFPMFATGTLLLLGGAMFLGGARLYRRNSYWDVA